MNKNFISYSDFPVININLIQFFYINKNDNSIVFVFKADTTGQEEYEIWSFASKEEVEMMFNKLKQMTSTDIFL